MKKVIIFDLDGVLINSVDLIHSLTLGEFKNITLKDAVDLHKQNIHEALKTVSWERITETPDEKETRLQTYTKNKKLVDIYNGIKEFIHELSNDYTLVINSSAKEENCIPPLERNGILSYFDLIAAKELHTSKVEKFNLIAKRYNQDIQKMIFVTDTIGDLKESASINLPTIAVTWGIHPREYFDMNLYPNLVTVVDTIPELKNIIDTTLKS